MLAPQGIPTVKAMRVYAITGPKFREKTLVPATGHRLNALAPELSIEIGL